MKIYPSKDDDGRPQINGPEIHGGINNKRYCVLFFFDKKSNGRPKRDGPFTIFRSLAFSIERPSHAWPRHWSIDKSRPFRLFKKEKEFFLSACVVKWKPFPPLIVAPSSVVTIIFFCFLLFILKKSPGTGGAFACVCCHRHDRLIRTFSLECIDNIQPPPKKGGEEAVHNFLSKNVFKRDDKKTSHVKPQNDLVSLLITDDNQNNFPSF